MKKLYSLPFLLFYLLNILLFFIIGLLYAGWIEAGKNQGLAAGAIFLSYGFIFALVALVIAIVLAYRLEKPIIVNSNIGLLVLVVLGFILLMQKAEQRREERTTPINEVPIDQTEPVEEIDIG